MSSVVSRYDELVARLTDQGLSIDSIESELNAFAVEIPSWAFANSGTRFGTFGQGGLPRDALEKLEDAAEVHRLTGLAPKVALHFPWDSVEDIQVLRERAAAFGLDIGAVNPNLFQDPDYRLGSLCNPDPAVRERATRFLCECVGIAGELGSDCVSLWLADGVNYAGQDDLRDRRERLVASMETVYARLPSSMELLVEYKPFEPGFYATDLADWGSALLLCQTLGERARVLVDLGHHFHGANVEQIVSLLQSVGRLGGFHFNDRRYADDDLIVGSANPLQLFLIFCELAATSAAIVDVRLTIDQSANIEPKVESLILSLVNLQEAYARALIVDRDRLREAQLDGDVLGAHRLLLDAYATDVRPLCAKVREERGAAADPLEAFRASGYLERVTVTRASGTAASWT